MLFANRNHTLCGIVAAALSAAGCGVVDTDSTMNGSAGRLAVAVTAAPEGAVCLSITVEGSRRSTQLFALTPGAGGQFELNGLPIGPVAVTGEVFAEPCAATGGKVPTYVSVAPVLADIDPSEVAKVVLRLTRNGLLDVLVDFEGETIIPNTTRVTDEETRGALTSYDPQTGIMRFSQSTSLLATLAPGEVLVSAPSSAAPAGYLRKVDAIRSEEAELVLETTQANLTDAIARGVLEARADLTGDDVASTTILLDGVTISASPHTRRPAAGTTGDRPEAAPTAPARSQTPQVGVGENFNFEISFHHTFIPQPSPDARGAVTVDGTVNFNAGYGVHVGISGCWELPPICVDSFEAKVGFAQNANLRVTGNAQGRLDTEIKVGTQYFKPQVFFIGPVPVVVVPRMDIFLSASGQVEVEFDFQASQASIAQLGARWTDSNGWRNISDFDFSGDVPTPVFTGVVKARAGARSAMSVRLYDVAGPEVSLQGGAELDGYIPRNPTWIVSGFLRGTLAFNVELPIIGTLVDYETTLFEASRELARAGNARPQLDLTANARPDPNVFPPGSPRIVGLRMPVDLKPGCAGIFGGGTYFVASDAEDGCPRVTVVSNRDGPLPSTFAFQTVGNRVLEVTARDSQGASAVRTFALSVVNTAPTLTLQSSGDPLQGEAYSIALQIADPNESDLGLLCTNTTWTLDAPDALASSTGCLQTVTFGTTGARQVRVTTVDSDGASAEQTLTFNVLPPPENPYPRIASSSMGSREIRNVSGTDFCVVRSVGNGVTINLTQVGCQIEPAPPAPSRYFIGAAVENPAGEALSYEWKLYATGTHENLVYASSASSLFELPDSGNAALGTYPCRVTLKVNAPDPLRSKGPTTLWIGQCIYHAGIVN